jgi:hypothetical protein
MALGYSVEAMATLIFVAWIGAMVLALGCLVVYCIAYGYAHGVARALLLFFKELLFGW